MFFAFKMIEIDFSGCSMDASSFALRISLLKFEPRVSNFPVLESDGTDSSTRATEKSHFYFGVRLWEGVWEIDFSKCSSGHKQLRTANFISILSFLVEKDSVFPYNEV